MSAILKLCSKCAIIEKGRITFFGDTREAIYQYLDRNSPLKQSEEISPSQHVKGTKESSIKKIIFSSSDTAESKNIFTINESINIRVDYTTEKTERKISFWILFTNQNGEVIISSFQKDSDKTIEPIAGEHSVNIGFEKIDLLPGKYSISAGIFSHNSLHDFEFSDWVESSQSLEISKTFFDGKPFDGRMGMVNKDANWQIIE